MSSKKEEKSQAAADRIKAAALSAAKGGLSRAQAERAATAAARNVNAYGQKEEGPSRWQERKEAKRQMYLMSTEKAVKLGVRKDVAGPAPSSTGGGGGQTSQCQRCFQAGHWTYECKNERVYMSRPSRTQQLKNPEMKMALSVTHEAEESEEDSGSSVTGSGSSEESNSSSSSSDSERRRRRRKKRRHHRYSSSSESESASESDSDERRRQRRSKRHGRRR